MKRKTSGKEKFSGKHCSLELILAIRPSVVSYLLRLAANYPYEWANSMTNSTEMIISIKVLFLASFTHTSCLLEESDVTKTHFF